MMEKTDITEANNKDTMQEKTTARSFRVTDHVAEKIREITKELGGNQQSAFARLIEAYEWVRAREHMPDKSESIDQFTSYTNAINRMYQTALEEAANARTLAGYDFESDLRRKEQQISSLTDEALSLKNDLEKTQELLRKTEADLKKITEDYVRLDNQHKILLASEEKNAVKMEKLDKSLQAMSAKELKYIKKQKDLEEENAELQGIARERSDTIGDLRHSLEKSASRIKGLEEDLEESRRNESDAFQRAASDAEIRLRTGFESELLKKEKEHMKEIRELTEKHEEENARFHSQYLELATRISNH